MKRILVVNNQDSFVYNLVELLREINVPFDIVLSDNINFALIDKYSGILISPGGGLPYDYPKMELLIKQYHTTIPMLGVCLGHQAIASCFGAELSQLRNPLHGHSGRLIIKSDDRLLLNGITSDSSIGQYHSWVINPNHIPSELQVIAVDNFSNIMIIRHREHPLYGVQFHPESIITDKCGKQLILNWCESL